MSRVYIECRSSKVTAAYDGLDFGCQKLGLACGGDLRLTLPIAYRHSALSSGVCVYR